MLHLLKDTQNPSSVLVQCCAKSEKAMQAMVDRNDQANLQPKLNKGPREYESHEYFCDRL